MKLSIDFRNLRGTGDTINHVDDRLSFAFSRTQDQIESISVVITGIHRHRDTMDFRCKVVVKPKGVKHISVTEKREDLLLAIDHSVARASSCVDRKLQRQLLLRKKTGFGVNLQGAMPGAIS